jgi:uncharacterized membrane protein
MSKLSTITKPVWKRLPGFFLQGLIIIAPIAITAYVLYSIVSNIDSWIPIFTEKDEAGKVTVKNYGLGFVLIIVTIIIVGYLSSFQLKNRLFSLFDGWMEKTPGVKYIYSTSKDIFSAFAGNKKKFNKPVLVSIEQEDIYRIGFITETDLKEFGLTNHVAVYVPSSYSIAGFVYLVPPHRVKKINNLSASEAMKFAISGGVADVDEEIARSPQDAAHKSLPEAATYEK